MEKRIYPLKKILVASIIILIGYLSYNLRANMFAAFPAVGDTRDEIKYAFNGISLIKKGVPESWSWYKEYGEFPVKEIRGAQYRLVKPYFDDPPLFALLMGAYSIRKGMDDYNKIDIGALRWPMIKIGTLNVVLLFILVYLISGFWEALIASSIYATVPTFVLSSRMPLAENFLSTLSLLSLIIFYFYLKKDRVIPQNSHLKY